MKKINVTAYNINKTFLKYPCPYCSKLHLHESKDDLSNREIKLIPNCIKFKFLSFIKRIKVTVSNETIKYYKY